LYFRFRGTTEIAGPPLPTFIVENFWAVMLDVADGLLVDIRNVSNRAAQFNANPEPNLAFGIVPMAVTLYSNLVDSWAAETVFEVSDLRALKRPSASHSDRQNSDQQIIQAANCD
jgi:hypothetical protein